MNQEFVRKLGVRQEHHLLVLGAPRDFSNQLLHLLPPGCCLDDAECDSPLDLVLLWVQNDPGLDQCLADLMHRLASNGAIWAVIPKKRALRGRPGPTFAAVQAAALPLGLVDNKDLGFSEEEYGIRLVIRRELRQKRAYAHALRQH